MEKSTANCTENNCEARLYMNQMVCNKCRLVFSVGETCKSNSKKEFLTREADENKSCFGKE